MCGIGGESARRAPADLAAVERMLPDLASRGPDGEGVVAARAGGARCTAGCASSTCPTRGAQPMVDSELGSGPGLQRLHLQLPGAARRADRRRLPLLLHLRHRGDPQGVPPVGRRCVERFNGMFAFAIAEPATRARWCWPGTGSASSRSTWPRRRAGCGSPPRCRRCSPPATWTPTLDPVALHHYMSFHSVVPAPRTILAGVRKLPPATVRVIQPDGTQHRHASTGRPEFDRGRRRCRWSADGLAGRARWTALRTAVRAADGRRRAGRRAALRRHRLQPRSWRCWPSRASTGWPRSASASRRPAGRPATSTTTPT